MAATAPPPPTLPPMPTAARFDPPSVLSDSAISQGNSAHASHIDLMAHRVDLNKAAVDGLTIHQVKVPSDKRTQPITASPTGQASVPSMQTMEYSNVRVPAAQAGVVLMPQVAIPAGLQGVSISTVAVPSRMNEAQMPKVAIPEDLRGITDFKRGDIPADLQGVTYKLGELVTLKRGEIPADLRGVSYKVGDLVHLKHSDIPSELHDITLRKAPKSAVRPAAMFLEVDSESGDVTTSSQCLVLQDELATVLADFRAQTGVNAKSVEAAIAPAHKLIADSDKALLALRAQSEVISQRVAADIAAVEVDSLALSKRMEEELHIRNLALLHELPSDCEYGPWTEWSTQCSCAGELTRHRPVLVPSAHGGVCPAVREVKKCSAPVACTDRIHDRDGRSVHVLEEPDTEKDVAQMQADFGRSTHVVEVTDTDPLSRVHLQVMEVSTNDKGQPHDLKKVPAVWATRTKRLRL